jgi:hypothetical protein
MWYISSVRFPNVRNPNAADIAHFRTDSVSHSLSGRFTDGGAVLFPREKGSATQVTRVHNHLSLTGSPVRGGR